MRPESSRTKRHRHAPYRVAIQGEWLRLNRTTGRGYFLLHDLERGCK